MPLARYARAPEPVPERTAPGRPARQMTRFAAAAVGIAAALALTACGSSASGSSSAKPASSYPGVKEDVALHNALPASYRQNGVKVAVFNDWPPDEFLQNNQLTGWSVDLAHAMAAVLGVKFSYIPTSFDAVLPGIQNGRYDAGFASFGITPQRLQVLSFIPERSDGETYAYLKSSHLDITALSDLCGHTVAVLTGAFDYQFLLSTSKSTCTSKGKPAISLKQFTTQTAAELAVESGRVQMTAAGAASLEYLAHQVKTLTTGPLVVNAVYNCIGVRKGDKLGQSLADALQQLINDGVYQKIMGKWGVGGLVTKGMLATQSNPDPHD